jgi:hypothetical protein
MVTVITLSRKDAVSGRNESDDMFELRFGADRRIRSPRDAVGCSPPSFRQPQT